MVNGDTAGRTFANLSVDELAEHAFTLYLTQGAHPLGAGLIYEALKRDPYHVLALRALADLLNQPGFSPFSAIVLEYAILYMESQDEAEIDALLERRMASLWGWGFLEDRFAPRQLQPADFRHSSNFIFKDEEYRQFIAPLFALSSTLEAAFSAAHRLSGVMAKFLEHADPTLQWSQEALFDGSAYRENDHYFQWLTHYDPRLDQLSRERLIFEMDKSVVT